MSVTTRENVQQCECERIERSPHITLSLSFANTYYQKNPSLTMVVSREVYASFSVTSGCLCFGALHNIWDGSLASVQGLPVVRPGASGTVKAHHLEFNVPAQNGIWNAFHFVNVNTKTVCGWFISHSDVDPDQEIDKILRVSGSPYEADSGSGKNNDKTRAEGYD